MRGDAQTGARPALGSHIDPAALERDIDRTRERLDHTLDALQARLSPRLLWDRALQFARDNGGAFAGNVGRTVRDNPLPLMLTGAGIVWLLSADWLHARAAAAGHSAGEGSHGRGLGGQAREAAGRVREAAGSTADSMRDAAATARERIGSTVQSTVQSTGEQARRMRAGLSHTLQEQPLVLGLAVLAAGALLGAALPPTDAEDRLLGPVRDEAAGKVRQAVSSAYEGVRAGVSEAGAAQAPPPAGSARTH
jgi:uncharacterized protein YjbJ (UPF0337 family)